MQLQKTPTYSNTPRTGGGFSAIELLITATILTIVTGVGVMGISQARANIRLSGAAREYATYIEKARMFSIRSHADDATERASVAVNDNKVSYDVTMDLDGDGGMDTKTITLPDGVEFDNVETIAFDWRGRTWNTANGITQSNAQVSIVLQYGDDLISIDVTGSGDITVDSEVFDDSVPDITLHVADLTGGPTPIPTPQTAAPTPTPTPLGTPDDRVIPVPTPTPGNGSGSGSSGSGSSGSGSSGSGSGSSGSGNNHGRPTPTPTPDAVPTPTPAPAICTLSLDLPQLVLTKDGTGSIKVSHDAGTSLTISGSSSKPSDLQVSPNSQTVAGGSSASFTIKSKKTIGTYTATFSTSCGSKTVTVLVVASLLGL